MGSSHPEHRHGEGATRLLAVARELFSARGFAEVCIRDLVDAAGVSRPTLYYYFESKEGLFRAAADQVITELDEALGKAAATAGTVRERVERMCRVLAESRYEWAFTGNLALHGARRKDEASLLPTRFAATPTILRRLAAVIAEGIDAGEVVPVDPHDAATAILGATGAAIVLPAGGADAGHRRDRLSRVVALVFSGLTDAGSAPRRGRARAVAGPSSPPPRTGGGPAATRSDRPDTTST